MLKALPGFALIELPQKYESGLKTEKEKYAERHEGILRDFTLVSEGEYSLAEDLVEFYNTASNKTVYFAPYEDGEVIKHEDKEYVFVPTRSLRGVKQDAEA